MDAGQLRTLYQNNSGVRVIVDHMAARQRNQTETKLKRILSLLQNDGHAARKPEIIAAFRELESAGCGEYVEGRHGWPSRFVWSVGSLSACQTAQGQDVAIEPVTMDDDDATPETLTHTFHLRPDHDIELTLPIDLTANEAARIAKFVESLPMEDYEWDR